MSGCGNEGGGSSNSETNDSDVDGHCKGVGPEPVVVALTAMGAEAMEVEATDVEPAATTKAT